MLGIAVFFLIIHTLDLGLVLGNKTAEPVAKAGAVVIDLVSIALATLMLIML